MKEKTLSFRCLQYRVSENTLNLLNTALTAAISWYNSQKGVLPLFYPLPVNELFDSSVSLDNLFGIPVIQQLEEQLYFADTIESKINIIEQFLTKELKAQQTDLLIENSIQQIQLSNGAVKIKELADSLNISHDAFEKRFRKTVGTTPKQFAAIVRMKSLIGRGDISASLGESALNAGFFDQSHFTREFKKFAGQTPREFFSLQGFR